MNRLIPVRLVLLAIVATTGHAAAQPPVYTRWTGTGNTTIPPAQGNFNQGTPLTLTWGFMALNTPINDNSSNGPNAPNNLQTRLNAIYGNQATWQPHFQSVFNRWSDVSGLSYQFEPNDDGATVTTSSTPRGLLGVRADLRIGGKPLDGNSGVLAYNYFPTHGDMVIDTNDNFFSTTSGNSIRLRNVVSHEHGHGNGMRHMESNNASFLMEPFINTGFDGPQYHDVLAAHFMYGDVREKSNAGQGNDTAARASPLGNLSSTVSVGNSARTLVVAPTATDFVSIDSQTDTDFFSITVDNGGTVSASLESLGFLYNITPQGGGGTTPFDTRLRNNLALALIDTDGTTILEFEDAGGLGANETLTFELDAAGTYFFRITGADNSDTIVLDAQFYALTASFAPIPEPSSVLLFASLVGGGGWFARRHLRTRCKAQV